MQDQAVIDAYLGAHHDVDLGDQTGIAQLEQDLAEDEESVVGTADAGVLAPEADAAPPGAPAADAPPADRKDVP